MLDDLNLRALQDLPSLQEIGNLLEVDTEPQAVTPQLPEHKQSTELPEAEPESESGSETAETTLDTPEVPAAPATDTPQ